MKIKSIKLSHLETALGFTVLAAEIVIGIPLALYYIGSEAYKNISQQAPQVNQQFNEFVTTIRSNLPSFSNHPYNPEESEDIDKDYNAS